MLFLYNYFSCLKHKSLLYFLLFVWRCLQYGQIQILALWYRVNMKKKKDFTKRTDKFLKLPLFSIMTGTCHMGINFLKFLCAGSFQLNLKAICNVGCLCCLLTQVFSWKLWEVLHKTVFCLTHYQTTNFRLFQTEDFADDNFKFDENGRKVFKRLVSQGRQKVSLCGNGLSCGTVKNNLFFRCPNT